MNKMKRGSEVVHDHEVAGKKKKSEKIFIRGTVILMKKVKYAFNDIEIEATKFGQGVTLQLVSAENANPENILEAKIEPPVHVEKNEKSPFKDITFRVTFEWNEDFGTPGAILVRNFHYGVKFYLKIVTLEAAPGRDLIHFICNSWVYDDNVYNPNVRVFFSNKTYLPYEMPEALRKYRVEELKILRGNGEGELNEWNRVYDYALYNDLGDPDSDKKLTRPVLGGTDKYPYHRRGRTSRTPSKSDATTESRKFPRNSRFNIYVPRDEQFGPLKKSEFEKNNSKAFFHGFIDKITATVFNGQFDSFEEVDKLFINGNFPWPQVIEADNTKPPTAWRTDEEFAREMIAGQNPLLIRRLQKFPPSSKLDPEVYGHQHSSITQQHIEQNIEGLTVEEALKSNRLFILDHHDTVIPYLWKINNDTSTKTYASRTLLFLQDDYRLKPVAIELSLPKEKDYKSGVVSKVYTPAEKGVEGSIWQLAKAYVAVVDTGHHQLISHWLNTHAAIEPFVIATNRQLSVVHPIYKLLHPHYRDTMAINALAREILVNADGLVEQTFYPAKYSMEMTSEIYKKWNFLDQALPNDLKNRGIAVEEINSVDDIDQLLIKDYPYAVDGLKIWFAIKDWVREYCQFYYKTDEMVQEDPELQDWWKELVEVGHGDLKDEPWWPKMQTLEELIYSCTIIIWIASALHAAVNFGQYAYGGYSPNRPTQSRRFMPEKGTPEYALLKKKPEKAFFETITPKLQCLVGMTLVEVLSQHSSDEVYLGQRDPDWTTDAKPVEAFKAFQNRLAEIEEEILSMNMDKTWKNRVGPVKVPYTLLFPTGEVGLSGKGIPNSISI
ncbi:hypothetical protein PTKIN_Ptkin01aG0319100 [Pterospermum kingtungense]